MIDALKASRFPLLAFVVALTFHAASPSGASASSPANLVEAFHQQLQSVMADSATLGFNGRRARLLPVVEQTFHSAAMARIISGEAWRGADNPTRLRLAHALRDMSIATYAARFDSYDGQTFATLGQRPGPRETQLVESAMQIPGEKTVKLTYVAKQIGGRWWLIDLIVDDGISEVAVRRSEYRGILGSGGIPALITSLEDQTRQLVASSR